MSVGYCIACGKRLNKPETAILTAYGLMCIKHQRDWVFDRKDKLMKCILYPAVAELIESGRDGVLHIDGYKVIVKNGKAEVVKCSQR